MATTNVTQKEIQCHFEKTQIRLKSYSGHQIPTRGVVTLPCEHKGNVYNVQFHVAEVEALAVLSAQTCKEMGLLVRIHQLQASQPASQSAPQLRIKIYCTSTQIYSRD